MAGSGKKRKGMTDSGRETLKALTDAKRAEADKRDAAIEKDATSIEDALTARLAAIPKLSQEELERREKAREERAAEEHRRKIVGLLSALRRDCGDRLDPFKKATIQGFERYAPKPMKKTLDALEAYLSNLSENVAAGNGLFLIGPPGTGKDHLAVAVAREAVIRLAISARWLDASSFRSELRDAIKSSKDEKRIVGPYLSAGVLVLSDPVAPGSGLTNYQADALFRLIDGRYRQCRPTFVTSNFSSETEAAELLGSQVVDRLSHGGLRLKCSWNSFRRR